MSGTLLCIDHESRSLPRYSMSNKVKRPLKLSMPGLWANTQLTISVHDQFRSVPDQSIDYIFIDPPFGTNLHYSELNFFWESWLKF